MRHFLSIFLIILLIFLCGCTEPQTEIQLVAPPTPTPAVPTSSPSPTKEPEPVYLIGTVSKLEDDFSYLREKAAQDSQIICGADIGAQFVVVSSAGGWARVLYDNAFGYIESKYLKLNPELTAAPVNKTYIYVPENQEMGLVHYKYNGKIKVVSTTYNEDGQTKQRVDVYTQSGTLLAKDASLVLKKASVSAPAIPAVVEDTQDTQTPAPEETPAATPVPVPVPVKINIKDGSITLSEGIELSKEPDFDIGEDKGRVISEDKTVIFYDNDWLSAAEFDIKEAKIYCDKGVIELEDDYYFIPAMLKDELVDVSHNSQDIKIDMLFAKDENLLDKNVYGEQVCLLQKSTLEKLKKASEMFKKDGYKIIIYDAYRPYSVTVMLYEKYKDGTYVAPIRFGSVHNKGAAIDMSLLDSDGNAIIMPSPIHTLDSSSNRNNKDMSEEAKANMDYMADVMKECGFTTIKSEWWHFSDKDANDYLRTDHDFQTLLKVVYE